MRVAVLLCTYNGERYLRQQLDSIVIPDGCEGRIVASDDGSTDGTLSLLRSYAHGPGGAQLSLRNGPGCGHRANFLSLLCSPEIEADVFAFCDQDDVWHSDKLGRAINALQGVTPDTPALYCARTRSLSEGGDIIGYSPLFRRPPAFANALVQNIAGGNTMVMNAAARRLLLAAGNVDVVMHDWWAYLLVSGAGGVVIYDPEPSLDYRQHTGNVVGANLGWYSRVARYLKFLGGDNRAWNDRNVRALRSCEHLLTESNRALLAVFEQMRHGSFWQRLRAWRRGGIYAQTRSGSCGLLAATILKKI